MMRPAGRQPGSVPPEAVFPVIAAAFIQQIGAALAVTIWPVLGGFGIVLLRFVVAETVLFAVIRPRVRGLTKRHCIAVCALVLALASMRTFLYNATGRSPSGSR